MPPDRSAPAAPAATDPIQLGAVRVLIVDDDELDRRAVRRCLRQAGISEPIDEAASEAETLERIGAADYDCILLDYYLPGPSGAGLVHKLRGAAPGSPVVMFTGRGDEDLAVEVMKSGAADYLPKASLTPERLAASIRHAVELARAAAARQEAERQLRAQELRFRTLANEIPQLSWTTDEAGACNWFNQRWYDYTGADFAQAHGWGWQALLHPEHVQRVTESYRRSVGTGAPWEDVFPIRGREGDWRWFLSRAVPIRNERGAIIGWLGTNTDITDRQTAQAERERLLELERAARAEAERAVRVRDEVLAFVAHDLRNLLATILMSASTLKPEGEANPRKAESIEHIRQCTKEMKRLIDDLLDVARLESNRFNIQPTPIDVGPILAEVCDLFGPQARSGHVELAWEAADVPRVRADRARVLQVLTNLLGNAFKFTPAGGHVWLRARRGDDGVEIAVIDSGSGISPDHLAHVFERFWQADRHTGAGAGLGLAICKGIVEAHGGRIAIESRPQAGTTVRFTLPLAEPPRPAAGAETRREHGARE